MSCGRVSADEDLDSLGPDNADALVAAYIDSKDARLDDVTAILFGQAMSDLIAANAAKIGPALVSRRLDLFMTEIVVQSRLASKYFHEGRRHVGEASGDGCSRARFASTPACSRATTVPARSRRRWAIRKPRRQQLS